MWSCAQLLWDFYILSVTLILASDIWLSDVWIAATATLKGWSLVLYGTVASHPGLLIRRLSSRQVHHRVSDRHQRAPGLYSRAGAAVPVIDCLIFNCVLYVYSVWLSLLAASGSYHQHRLYMWSVHHCLLMMIAAVFLKSLAGSVQLYGLPYPSQRVCIQLALHVLMWVHDALLCCFLMMILLSSAYFTSCNQLIWKCFCWRNLLRKCAFILVIGSMEPRASLVIHNLMNSAFLHFWISVSCLHFIRYGFVMSQT